MNTFSCRCPGFICFAALGSEIRSGNVRFCFHGADVVTALLGEGLLLLNYREMETGEKTTDR